MDAPNKRFPGVHCMLSDFFYISFQEEKNYTDDIEVCISCIIYDWLSIIGLIDSLINRDASPLQSYDCMQLISKLLQSRCHGKNFHLEYFIVSLLPETTLSHPRSLLLSLNARLHFIWKPTKPEKSLLPPVRVGKLQICGSQLTCGQGWDRQLGCGAVSQLDKHLLPLSATVYIFCSHAAAHTQICCFSSTYWTLSLMLGRFVNKWFTNTTTQWRFRGAKKKKTLTFRVKEMRLPTVVNHFLLALLWPWHDGVQLFRRSAVVELHDVRSLKRGALDGDWSRAVVSQHRPHSLV